MLSLDKIKASLERLIANTPSEGDPDIVREALLSGNIVYVEGEGNAVEGENVAGAFIVTSDKPQTKYELSHTVYGRLRDILFPLPPGILPPLPSLLFIGREESLKDVKELLGIGVQNPASPHPPTAIIRGWPGVGKTALVGVLARDPDVTKTYPDGVLWASLSQRPSLMSILAQWGRALGSDELLRVPTPEEAVQKLVVMLQHKRMLLVIDEVWDPAHAAILMRARGSNCGLLITTRLPSVAKALDGTESSIYLLPVLNDEDALTLMRALAPSVVEQHTDECLELIRELEYLPLALHVAARLLRAESKLGLSTLKLIQDIREGAAIVQASAPLDRLEVDTIPTVTALLQKSTDMLSDQTRVFFAYLGVFAPRPATFDLQALKAIWEVEDPRPIVRELIGRGLLEAAGPGKFQVHAVLIKHALSLLN
jgi:hypothetical protein